jgi:hypothetical protein
MIQQRAIFRFVILALVATGVFAPGGLAGSVTQFNADVKEWSSSTPADPTNGIYPIGGSGEINGGFVVSTGSDGSQIGIRGFLRGVGQLPQTNDGVTATYSAHTGTSGNNLSLWNFDVDIDLRGTGHTLSDYSAVLTFTDRSGLVTPLDLLANGSPGNLVLGQSSENPGFAFLSAIFPSFDPNAPGVYSFDLKLVPTTFTGDTLEASMKVAVSPVPEPAGLVVAGFVALGCCLRSAVRRR